MEIDLKGQKFVDENRECEDSFSSQKKLESEVIKDNVAVTDASGGDSMVGQETDDTVPLQIKLENEIIDEEITSTHHLKKKEISWNDSSYLDKVPLQQNLRARSITGMLERKASVGPCYRKTAPFGEPSGITICLPKKSIKPMNEIINPNKSGISITVSKRCFDTKPSTMDSEQKAEKLNRNKKGVELKIEEGHCTHIFINIREKIDNFCGKLKHVMRNM